MHSNTCILRKKKTTFHLDKSYVNDQETLIRLMLMPLVIMCPVRISNLTHIENNEGIITLG